MPQVDIVEGDMRDARALDRLLVEGCTWINLVHLEFPSDQARKATLAPISEICRRKAVRRVVHCSSAVVIGRSSANVVDENTPCRPRGAYEVGKLAMEAYFRQLSPSTTVLRPTAVFGSGGRNLMKLADDLTRRPRWLNYVKSSLQGSRRMNLIHVDNVVAALEFLAAASDVAGEVFIVSDDEYPTNNFRDVEQILMRELGVAAYRLPSTPVPPLVLSSLLRLAGRSNVNPERTYDASKILGRGLRKPRPLDEGLRDFAAWYRAR